jgi:hypothetical protein
MTMPVVVTDPGSRARQLDAQPIHGLRSRRTPIWLFSMPSAVLALYRRPPHPRVPALLGETGLVRNRYRVTLALSFDDIFP